MGFVGEAEIDLARFESAASALGLDMAEFEDILASAMPEAMAALRGWPYLARGLVR